MPSSWGALSALLSTAEMVAGPWVGSARCPGQAAPPSAPVTCSVCPQSICAAVAFFYSNYLLLHWQLLVMVTFGFFGTLAFFTVEWDAAAIVARGSDYRSI